MEARLKGMIDSALDKLAGQLEAGQSEQLTAYLRALGRFTRYSAGNVILIWLQNPEATHVAGFWTWKKFGRKVKRGEKGIRILAPVTKRETVLLENDEEYSDESLVCFKKAYVWDLLQTEGKPLPEPARVVGDPGVYGQRLREFVSQLNIELKTSRRLGLTQGVSSGGSIVLNETLDSANSFAALVHELAHELLHHTGGKVLEAKQRETEAEAVAYVVCEAIGLSTRTSCSDYLLSYRSDKRSLLQSLQNIQQTAAVIIDAIQPSKVSVKHPKAA